MVHREAPSRFGCQVFALIALFFSMIRLSIVAIRLMFWGTYWTIKLTIYACILMFHFTVWAIKGAVALTALIIAGVSMIIAARRSHNAQQVP